MPASKEKDNWSFDPFEASIDSNNEFIYARGTIDDKSSMISQLEAVRVFLKRKGQPNRTIYLAYGHDEEISGMNGAGKIVDCLNQTQLEYVIDEGSVIIDDFLPAAQKPVAYIGIAEKGFLTLKFYVNMSELGGSGHSSMPDSSKNPINILSQSISK